jgi:hypothetical protein
LCRRPADRGEGTPSSRSHRVDLIEQLTELISGAGAYLANGLKFGHVLNRGRSSVGSAKARDECKVRPVDTDLVNKATEMFLRGCYAELDP